ncbi:Protein arginine N-methyltransferase 3 [Quaeritorhiza haematococci]|nr:Protein arginine N-methyltransferase 3 [Quaeritorhiza haematococci]
MSNHEDDRLSDESFSNDERDEQDDQWSDWNEEDDSETLCPFCSFVAKGPTAIFDHCKEQHKFDFKAVRQQLGLDIYGCIRLVNYVRTEAKTNQSISVASLVEGDREWLKDEKYLKPVLPEDPLLYSFDDELDNDEEIQTLANDMSKLKAGTDAESRVELAEKRAHDAERELAELREAFVQYKDMIRQRFLEDNAADTPTVQREPAEDDDEAMDYYFGSYAENEIHESMLKDAVRTESYRDFIYNNKQSFKDKASILSMFAAKAGARKVYAVDNSTIIKKARRIAKENGLDNIITFIRGKIEEITLPEKVDIIISEWMGYFLLFEGMLDSVLVARDRWLAPGGMVGPSHTSILIAGMQDEEWLNDTFHFWNEPMKDDVLAYGQVDFIDGKSLITDAVTIKDIDISTATIASLDFTTPFELKATRQSRMYAICGWFDTWFDPERDAVERKSKSFSPVFFSTGPNAIGTHWKQTIFVLENPIDLDLGSTVKGQFRCQKSKENPRELVVNITADVIDSKAQTLSKISQTFQVR